MKEWVRSKKRIGVLLVAVCTITVLLGGCASIQAFIREAIGELLGNDYIITQYDTYGNKVTTMYGDKITMQDVADTSGEQSAYIKITVDGNEWRHVGSTLIFRQAGVDMITDFEVPSQMGTQGSDSTGFMPIDRYINDWKNEFGTGKVVLVSSQDGIPIALFRGNDCYTKIPDDLPKTTMIYIDGKLVYAHRACVDIYSTALFEGMR